MLGGCATFAKPLNPLHVLHPCILLGSLRGGWLVELPDSETCGNGGDRKSETFMLAPLPANGAGELGLLTLGHL